MIVLGAQDLWPEGHRRAVCAPQAARAHRSADARRRPRARHALGHAADAPDRRHGRGVPHRQARKWRPRTSASACCATGCSTGLSEIEEVYRQRRHGTARAAQPERQLQLRRRRVADHGDQGRRGVVGLGVHVGLARAVVRAARAGPQRRTRAQLDPLHRRPLHDRSRRSTTRSTC